MKELSIWQRVKLPWLLLAIVVLFVDQITKYCALNYLPFGEAKRILPFFNFTLAYNTGAAFSFLNSAGGWQMWFFAAIAVVVSTIILIWLVRLPPGSHWVSCALALILGGALGNLWDRVQYGYVIDFLDFHFKQYHWPIFNMADTAITIGAIMLLIDVFFNDNQNRG